MGMSTDYSFSRPAKGFERMTNVKPMISTPTPASTKIDLAFAGMRRITAAATMAHPASSNRKPASFMHIPCAWQESVPKRIGNIT
jgi:hypothetical protein